MDVEQKVKVDLKTGALALAVATAVGAGPFNGPGWLVIVALALTAALLVFRTIQSRVEGYAATISLQVAHSLALVRFAISDLFILSVIFREIVTAVKRREGLPSSSMSRPLALLAAAFVIAAAVGFARLGYLSSYVVINRLAGIAFLIAGFLALVRVLDTSERVTRVAEYFVVGVAVANVGALLASLSWFFGIPNTVYIVGSFRLNGWVGNPSLYGGVLVTAALLELGMLASVPRAGKLERWRWINLGMFAISIILTLSRSAWLSLSIGATVLRLVQVGRQDQLPSRRRTHLRILNAWAVAPALMMAGIVLVNAVTGVEPLADRIANLKDAGARAASKPAETGAEAAPLDPTVVFKPEGTMFNARGLLDRMAIEQMAWADYTSSPQSMLLGIGLGTFLETSTALIGYAVIVHNSFTWFLIELGPLGFLSLIWVLWQTSRNLWQAYWLGDARRDLVCVLSGAFAAMLVFMLFNEAFYHRHYWLLLLLAERVASVSSWAAVEPSAASLPSGA